MSEQTSRPLDTPGDYATAVIDLLNTARQSVEIFSPDLNPVVFGSSDLIAAVRSFVTRNKHSTMRVLIRDTGPLTRDDHRFLAVAQRISSKIIVRKLATDFYSRDDAFVIADDTQYALRKQASSWAGLYDQTRPEVARQRLTAFEEMWAHSVPDPGIRRLHI
ncbi:MAG: hypothetical protein OER80_04455 [Gammaproteobacteria bacterium]|nr:hypothetical protein [Gammaproteobacteria bacterium]MDH3768172.1 hypothetical protein [Gammaproteobacteria bacterium]